MDVVGSKRNMTEEDNTHSVSYGLQQAMTYARMLDVPFAYHSTGNNVGTALLYQSDDLQFYDNMDISPAIKMIFIELIRMIYWRNRLAQLQSILLQVYW